MLKTHWGRNLVIAAYNLHRSLMGLISTINKAIHRAANGENSYWKIYNYLILLPAYEKNSTRQQAWLRESMPAVFIAANLCGK